MQTFLGNYQKMLQTNKHNKGITRKEKNKELKKGGIQHQKTAKVSSEMKAVQGT